MSSLNDNNLPPASGIVTLLTDFGHADGFVAAMKGVMLGIYRSAQIVDLTHDIAPQNIAAGEFLLSAHFKYFPRGTVHVAVIDPGVGTARKAIACYWQGHYFVAPDNGVLDFCARDESCLAVALTRREYWRQEISHTFHGRDIFAPVAAHLAAGVPLIKLGESTRLKPRASSQACRIAGDALRGQIVHIDRFGNLISNITKTAFADFVARQAFAIHFEEKLFTAITPSYGYARAGEALALFNSFDRLEIAVAQDSAQAFFSATPGTFIIIKRRS